MADFFIYQPIDMLNEEHLGASYSTRYLGSQSGWENMDSKGYQTVTSTLTSGFIKIDRYQSPGRDSANVFEFSKEIKGRLKIDGYKLYYADWISIYGEKSFFSDLQKINTGVETVPGKEVEIFAKILESSDNITGSGGGDYLYSFRGDDLVNPAGGDDYVNGGSGIDTVEYSGKRSQYTLSQATDPSGIQSVTDYSDPNSPQVIYLASVDRAFKVSGPDGNDTLVDVEKLKFKDGTYNIATGAFAEEDNSSSSGKSKGETSKKAKCRKGNRNKR